MEQVMSISAVSSASLYSAASTNQPAPVKRDKDGDYDNNARETKQSEATKPGGTPGRLNVTA